MILERVLLGDVAAIERRLAAIERTGVAVPNTFQLSLGVLRMWHRILFRSETIGTARDRPVRGSPRARRLERRAVRFFFLMRERAIAPLDASGLRSSPARIARHLLAAHHDETQFLYDFELLGAERAVLERVWQDARAIADGRHPRSEWLKDLVVYDGYHDELAAAARAFLDGTLDVDARLRGDPDISFYAYLAWCRRQPATFRESLSTLRRLGREAHA
jgi:hypothetical protein